MKQIFRAVHYLHSSGVVHRDIKPENFLLLRDGPITNNVVKLVDFGFAREWKQGQVLTTKVGTPFYVSPQLLDGNYDNKNDIWACGIIMYALLIGHPPFMGKTDHELFGMIRRAQLQFSKSAAKRVSTNAMDLIGWLLTYEQRCRFSAQQALEHCWCRKNTVTSPSASLQLGLVANIRNFQQQNKLKKAAIRVLVGQLNADLPAISSLREMFVELDVDNDGLLTTEELWLGLERAGMEIIPEEELLALQRGMDTDKDHKINYTEFLAATIDRHLYTDETRCRNVFDVFDLDSDGYITQPDVRMLLSGSGPAKATDERDATKLVAQIDRNSDRKIDFEEFLHMMRSGAL
jgi:calcium-dependent protein kinase